MVQVKEKTCAEHSFFSATALSDVITPLRIAYHPGVVLEVVEGTKSCSEAPRGAGLTYDPATAESRSGGTGLPKGLSSGTVTDTNSLILATANLSIAYANHDDLSRPKYLGETPGEARSVIRAYNHLHSDYFESVLLGQEMQAVTIKQSMDVHFDRLLAEMDKNKELQEQVLRTQQQMDIRDQQMQQLQQQTREELLEKQQDAENAARDGRETGSYPSDAATGARPVGYYPKQSAGLACPDIRTA